MQNLKLIWFSALFVLAMFTSRADIMDTWTTNRVTTNTFSSGFGDTNFLHVVYGNGIYVATADHGDGGSIFTSPDGFNWTMRFSDLNSWGLTLDYSSGHFSGVSGIAITDVSADGTNWTSTFLSSVFPQVNPGNLAYSGTTYGGTGLYVAVGATNGVGSILTSANGSTWTPRNISPAGNSPIHDIAYGASRFVAIGNNDGYEYAAATTGIAWTRSTIPGGSKISFTNSHFFVPLNNGTNLVSTDGLNWNTIPTGLTNILGKVFYSHGLYLSQCGSSPNGRYLATSTDGINWVQYPRSLPNAGVASYNDPSFATDGTRLILAGGYDYTSYPTLGIIFESGILADVRMTNNPTPKVALTGLVGRNYQIQSSESLNGGANAWRTNVTLQLPSTSYIWTDAGSTNTRFYRAVLLP